MSCIICAENFNKSNRLKVSCQYCSFEACRSCCERYLLDKQVSCCMNTNKKPDGTFECGNVWTRQFMVKNFTKKFVNKEWKEICEKNLFDREKALLPATTAYIEQQKHVSLLRKDVMDINKEIRNMQEIIKLLKEKKSNLEIMIHNGGDAIKTSNSYNGRICGDSNCRGYLSNQWKCGVCDKYTCKDCNVVKESRDDVNHVCKKEDVETMKLLAKDTKSCPKCKVPIFKIEGCDQMWCTKCHTAFSWKTGNIESRIHNPHYYEWQRDQNNGVAPRVHGDFECGRTIMGNHGRRILHDLINNCFGFLCTYFEAARIEILQKVGDDKDSSNEQITNLIDKIKNRNKKNVRIFHRMVHLQGEEINNFRVDDLENNLDLRIKYLTNEITEDIFKRKCQQRNKKNEQNRDIYNIANLLVQTYTDIIYRFHESTSWWSRPPNHFKHHQNKWSNLKESMKTFIKLIDNYFIELHNIIKYCNNLLIENKNIYGGKGYEITVTSNRYQIGYTNRFYNVFQRIVD